MTRGAGCSEGSADDRYLGDVTEDGSNDDDSDCDYLSTLAGSFVMGDSVMLAVLKLVRLPGLL